MLGRVITSTVLLLLLPVRCRGGFEHKDEGTPFMQCTLISHFQAQMLTNLNICSIIFCVESSI
jgi:hypothetical protein